MYYIYPEFTFLTQFNDYSKYCKNTKHYICRFSATIGNKVYPFHTLLSRYLRPKPQISCHDMTSSKGRAGVGRRKSTQPPVRFSTIALWTVAYWTKGYRILNVFLLLILKRFLFNFLKEGEEIFYVDGRFLCKYIQLLILFLRY